MIDRLCQSDYRLCFSQPIPTTRINCCTMLVLQHIKMKFFQPYNIINRTVGNINDAPSIVSDTTTYCQELNFPINFCFLQNTSYYSWLLGFRLVQIMFSSITQLSHH